MKGNSVARPPKSGDRKPCGRLRQKRQSRDYGTPETILKRQRLVGAGDPTRAHYPLGIALETGLLDEQEHNIGLAYARTFKLALGCPGVRANPGMARLLPSDSREVPEDIVEQATALYLQMAEALLRLGRMVKETVDDWTIYEQFLPQRVDQLREGLKALKDYA